MGAQSEEVGEEVAAKKEGRRTLGAHGPEEFGITVDTTVQIGCEEAASQRRRVLSLSVLRGLSGEEWGPARVNIPGGRFELPTPCSTDRCSNQLSYPGICDYQIIKKFNLVKKLKTLYFFDPYGAAYNKKVTKKSRFLKKPALYISGSK